MMDYGGRRQRSSGFGFRVLIAVGLALFAVIRYYSGGEVNPTTGRKQQVAMSAEQEMALGMRAAPSMAQQYGGAITTGPEAELVRAIGSRIVRETEVAKSPYKFQFHLLRDNQTVNAFALPGGQIFITKALFDRLETEGQVAAVLGHEVGHVVARHGAQQLAKQQLTQGLVGSAGVLGGGDSQGIAAQVGAMMNLKYGRNDEYEADSFGVKYSGETGYDPRAMQGVMKVLASLSSGGRQPEMLSTHPNPENRAERIEELIREHFPDGLPSGLRR